MVNSYRSDIEVHIDQDAELQSSDNQQDEPTWNRACPERSGYGRLRKLPGRFSEQESSTLRREKQNIRESEMNQATANKEAAHHDALVFLDDLQQQGKMNTKSLSEKWADLLEERNEWKGRYEKVGEEKQKKNLTLQKIKAAKAKLCKEYKQVKCERKELKSKLKENDNALRAMKDQIVSQEKAHNMELANRDECIANAQKGMADVLRRGATDALTDDFVRGKLDEIKLPCSQWARKYCAKSFAGADGTFLEKILKNGTPFQLSPEEQRIQYSSILNCNSGPRLFLNHIISFAIFDCYYGDPFASFENAPGGEGMMLSKLLEIMEAKDMGTAQEWRRQTIRGLEPRTDAASHSSGQSLQLDIFRLREENYGDNVEVLLDYVKPLLRDTEFDEPQERCRELLEIIRNAANFATRLFSQKVKMKVVRSWERADDAFLFHIRSELMNPHPSMLLDDDSHEYDGCLVGFMVEPAIIAYGNEAGENYNEWKVFMKMTVLVLPPCNNKQQVSSTFGKTKRKSPEGPVKKSTEGDKSPKKMRLEPETEPANTTVPSDSQKLVGSSSNGEKVESAKLEDPESTSRPSTKYIHAIYASRQISSSNSELAPNRVEANTEMPPRSDTLQGSYSAQANEGIETKHQRNRPRQHEGEKAQTPNARALSPMRGLHNTMSQNEKDAFDRDSLANTERGRNFHLNDQSHGAKRKGQRSSRNAYGNTVAVVDLT